MHLSFKAEERIKSHSNLIGDAKSNNTNAHPFDRCDFIVQFISIICRYTVCNENDNTLCVRSLLVIATKHFQSCDLETARCVRVLAEISKPVYGRQHFGFRRIVP